MAQSFQYTTALDKIRKMTARIKIIQGGAGASKTWSIIPILINECLSKPGQRVSIVSRDLPHLRRGAIADMILILKITGRYIDSNWNRTYFTYRFGNGSYIEFFSCDNSSKLRGPRRDYLFINECNYISYTSYQELYDRTNSDIYLDFNPSNKFWIEEVKKSEYSESIILTYRDNDAITQNTLNGYLEKRKLAAAGSKYWQNYCDVMLDGKYGRLEGVIFENYDIIDSIPPEASLIACGLDWGFTNDPTVLVAVYKYDGKIILDELIYETGLFNSQIAKRIKEFDETVEVIADSAEPKSIAEIRRMGIRIIPANKGKDSVMYGIGLMQEQQFLITQRSYNLIDEFDKYSWKKDRNGQQLNVPIDDYNHGIDAIRYVAMMKLSNRSGPYRPTFRIR